MERVFFNLILLWANVMSFNLPCCWDPITQQWKMSHDFGNVLYVMPHSPEPAVNCSKDDEPCADKCNKNWQCYRERDECGCCRHVEELIVVDTDGSADDAMAIVMLLNAFKNKTRVAVAGITCTWGSTSVRKATKNVIKTLKACDNFCQVPVYAGADQGLVESKTVTSKYGLDAFGDFLYLPNVNEDICEEHPAIFIANLVRDNPGKVTIMCTGPLCNIAIATHLYPDFYRNVHRIFYLGGSSRETFDETDNVDLASNDGLDPYALQVVMEKESVADGPKITLFSKELTDGLEFSQEWRTELGKKETPAMELLNYAESKALDGQWVCKSPVLAAALIDPRIITSTLIGVCSVERGTGKTMLSTSSPPEPNVLVVKTVNNESVRKIIEDNV